MRPSTLLTLLILSFATNFGPPIGMPILEPSSSPAARSAEDYEALLMTSVKGWDDFQKRFKKATNVTMATEGGETILRGTIEAYDVKNSTFEARFASPTRITRLVVTLDPVNAKDRRLRSDLSSKFAKGQPDLEDWLPKPVRDARDRLLVEKLDVEFSEGNMPSKATLVSKIPLQYQLVPGLDLSLSSIDFIFTVTDPASRSRAGLTATLAGDLSVGPGMTRLSGSISTKDSREAWTLAAQLDEIRLQTLLESVAGRAALNGMVIPPEISGLFLKEATIEIAQSKSTVSARATSPFGAVGMKVFRGKSGAAFQMGVAPPESFRFASLAPELALMDNLGLQNSALIIASEQMPADLPNLTNVTGAQVNRGVTMMGGFDLRGASPQVADMLKVDQIIMRGTIGTTLSDVRFEGKVDMQIPLVPNSNAAVLRGIVVRMVPGAAGATLSLGGLVDVKADRQTLTFAADIAIDFVGPSLYVQGMLSAVDGTMAAYWSNPFGIAKGLHVKDLGLALGINLGAPIPMPILGLQGELVAGDLNRPDFRGRAAIGIDPADPQKTVIDVGFDRLLLREILNAAAPQAMQSLPRELQYALDIGLHDARLTIVPAPGGADLFGVHYDAGFLVQGAAEIGDWSGELYVAVDYEKGLEARATADAIHAEPWFSLTGARGEPDPYISIRIEPGPGSFVALSGAVMALGLQAETDILMYGEGFDFFLAGKVLGGVFEASIEVAGGDLKQGGTLYAVAEMKNDLFRYMTENASQQIDAATKSMQADITKAQREVSDATQQIRSLDGEIAAYRAQLERNRDQVCLDIKNGNGDVRGAEQEVARLRQQFDNIPNDPGVVAARNRMVAAEQELTRMRQAVNMIEQDPGVVEARNRVIAAEAEVTRSRNAVAALDNDPGLVQARANLAAAQRNVSTLEGNISAQKTEVARLERKLKNAAAWDYPGVLAELGVANGALGGLEIAIRSARFGVSSSQSILDGLVSAAQQTAYAGISGAEGTLQLTRQGYDGVLAAARQTADLGLQGAEGTVNLTRQSYDGLILAGQQTIQGLMRGAEGTLQAAQAGAQLTYDACVAAPIEIDPRLAGFIGSKELAQKTLEGSNYFLEGIKQAATGTMVAADWIVKNGNPLGVVNIEYAKFEGCLAMVEGGKVSLEFRGKFAGEPISGSLAMDLVSPLDAVNYLADYLINNKTGPMQARSGNCAKPSFVGRPGNPNASGMSVKRVPLNPNDLSGSKTPAITVPQVPSGLGVLPPRT